MNHVLDRPKLISPLCYHILVSRQRDFEGFCRGNMRLREGMPAHPDNVSAQPQAKLGEYGNCFEDRGRMRERTAIERLFAVDERLSCRQGTAN